MSANRDATPEPKHRTLTLNLRISADEKAAIEQRAIEYSGRVGKLTSISDYIRKTAIGCKEAA
jgi:hypothetical protein